jgi:DNA-binding NarL/FixJ family response regulator
MKNEHISKRATAVVSTPEASEDAARLVEQIRSLLSNPEAMPLMPGRSLIFQVAAQLELPQLTQTVTASSASTITGEIFACIRNEAMKAQSATQTTPPAASKRKKSPAAKTTVLLVEDHAVFRDCFRKMLEAEGNMEVICEAQHGQEAVSLAREFHPDLVLMDVSMPHLNGFEAARQIRKDCPNTKVVFISGHKEDSYVQSAVECGAQGFVFKQTPFKTIRQALRQVQNGRSYFSSPGMDVGEPLAGASRAGKKRPQAASSATVDNLQTV